MNVVHTLKIDIDKGSSYSDGSFLVSAITILCILFEVAIISQLSEQDCSTIALLLRESYRPEKNTCPAYAALQVHLPTANFGYYKIISLQCLNYDYNYRKDIVGSALKQLALTIIIKSNEKSWQWLFVVPLFHFMSGLSSPYQPFPLEREITWKFWFELEGVRNKQSKRFVLHYVPLTKLFKTVRMLVSY